MNYPVMINCYSRLDTLKRVVKSLIKYNPSKWYFHIHDSDNKEDQVKVNEVYEYLLSLDLNKEIVHSGEPLGCSKSFYKMLEYVSNEDGVLVFEDDIELLDHKKINEYINEGDEIVKFGENSELRSHYWGWYLNKKSMKQILDFDFKLIDINRELPYSKLFWEGTVELYKRGDGRPWDEEVSLICDYNNIKVEIKDPITKHIGVESSRVGGIKEFRTSYVKFVNGKIII